MSTSVQSHDKAPAQNLAPLIEEDSAEFDSGESTLPPWELGHCPRCKWNSNDSELFSLDKEWREDGYIIRPMFISGDFNYREQYTCKRCIILAGFFQAIGLPGKRKYDYTKRTKDGLEVVESDVSFRFVSMQPYIVNRYEVYTSVLDPTKLIGVPQFPHISGDTSSPAALDWIKHQLQCCLTLHTRCELLREPSILPTRLVKLDVFCDSKDIVLVESVSIPKNSKYIALSHCWGGVSIPCMTKSSNLLQQKRRILWESLTPSFQDAVTFTRGLGVDYVWIDSICIIQDSIDDWSREAARMFGVYQNAYATLAGVHAKDGSEGLFSKSSKTQMPFPKLNIDGKNYQLYARPRLARFHDWDNDSLPEKAPLFTRAWAYQERLISPRVIYFTEDEILWECFTETACECSGTTAPSITASNPRLNYVASFLGADYDERMTKFLTERPERVFYQQRGLASKERELNAEQKRHQYYIEQWHYIVQQYSNLELTVKRDRLPAIAAIAEQLQRRRNKEIYLAGVWSGSLVQDLLWFGADYSFGCVQNMTAPTWSWASLESKVQFYCCEASRVQVVDAICEYDGENPFGLVKAGRIIIKGSLVSFKLTITYTDSCIDGERSQTQKLVLEHKELDHPLDICIDDECKVISNNIEFLFALDLAQINGKYNYYLLLIKTTTSADPDLYARVGHLRYCADSLKLIFQNYGQVKAYTII